MLPGLLCHHQHDLKWIIAIISSVIIYVMERFQATVLDFAGDLQWVQFGDGGERVEFLANRTREGTFPPGSQWSRNPIPACIEADGGYMQNNFNCDQGTQFPPPAPGLFGYGENHISPGEPSFKWSLMDEVWIPGELEPGAYTLSFRSSLHIHCVECF